MEYIPAPRETGPAGSVRAKAGALLLFVLALYLWLPALLSAVREQYVWIWFDKPGLLLGVVFSYTAWRALRFQMRLGWLDQASLRQIQKAFKADSSLTCVAGHKSGPASQLSAREAAKRRKRTLKDIKLSIFSTDNHVIRGCGLFLAGAFVDLLLAFVPAAPGWFLGASIILKLLAWVHWLIALYVL